ESVFGRDRVFMDLDSIPFGVDFRTHISESLNRCHTLLVVIGSQWLGASTEGSCRIDDPTDFVRLEVAQALARNIRLIALLIDRTEMPSCTVLPDDLKNLAFAMRSAWIRAPIFAITWTGCAAVSNVSPVVSTHRRH